jgi:hypothetical protein
MGESTSNALTARTALCGREVGPQRNNTVATGRCSDKHACHRHNMNLSTTSHKQGVRLCETATTTNTRMVCACLTGCALALTEVLPDTRLRVHI